MTHLSAEQIAQWIAGERTVEVELHAAGCERCRARVAEFDEVLVQFRSSALSVNARENIGWREKAPAPRRKLWVAVAALGLLAVVPVYRERQARERAAREQQDAQLLQQVDAEISRAVPGAMDPLVKMVSWNQNEAQK